MQPPIREANEENGTISDYVWKIRGESLRNQIIYRYIINVSNCLIQHQIAQTIRSENLTRIRFQKIVSMNEFLKLIFTIFQNILSFACKSLSSYTSPTSQKWKLDGISCGMPERDTFEFFLRNSSRETLPIQKASYCVSCHFKKQL